MRYVRAIRPLAYALAIAGAAFLVASFLLHPTPVEWVPIPGGKPVPVYNDGAVDYLISALRVLGIPLVIAGVYLAFRDLRPDAIEPEDGIPPSTHDPYSDISPLNGNPVSRSGVG